jgi:FkbM family methyltransferase
MNLQAIEKYFYPNKILDIGANIGQFYRECKEAFPSSYVFSIEANQNCSTPLSRVTPNFTIALLGAKEGPTKFYRNRVSDVCTGNSIYREESEHFQGEKLLVTEENMVTLDSLNLPEFDLIKLDTQGSELDIIKGGLNLCRKARALLLEVSVVPCNQGAPLEEEVTKALFDLGFHKMEILENHIYEGKVTQIDILYLNSFVSHYGPLGSRADYLTVIEKQKHGVIDIGGVGNKWAGDRVTHTVDINGVESDNVFVGNISLPHVWKKVLDYVDKNGLFDYSIATHVLEDVGNPKLVCEMLGAISKRGLLAFPSKYKELIRQEGPYRGYIHHRWIFNVEDNQLVAYPKLGFLEHDTVFDELARKNQFGNEELQIEWLGKIDLKIVNDDFLGPNVESVKQYYRKLL